MYYKSLAKFIKKQWINKTKDLEVFALTVPDTRYVQRFTFIYPLSERESLGEASVDVDSTGFSDSEGDLRLIDAFASLDSTESLELEEEDTVSLNTTIPSAKSFNTPRKLPNNNTATMRISMTWVIPTVID